MDQHDIPSFIIQDIPKLDFNLQRGASVGINKYYFIRHRTANKAGDIGYDFIDDGMEFVCHDLN